MKRLLTITFLFVIAQACSNASSQKNQVEKSSNDSSGQLQGKRGNGEDFEPKYKSEKDKSISLAAHCEKVKQSPSDYSEEDVILCSNN